MKPIKKIEIITDSLELPKLLARLETIGVAGYTVIREVTGMGERGLRAGDELTGVFKNSYIIVACPEEEVSGVVEAVRPILKRFGGVCLVSDAQWVIH